MVYILKTKHDQFLNKIYTAKIHYLIKWLCIGETTKNGIGNHIKRYSVQVKFFSSKISMYISNSHTCA